MAPLLFWCDKSKQFFKTTKIFFLKSKNPLKKINASEPACVPLSFYTFAG
jgi:hypothetical protein